MATLPERFKAQAQERTVQIELWCFNLKNAGESVFKKRDNIP